MLHHLNRASLTGHVSARHVSAGHFQQGMSNRPCPNRTCLNRACLSRFVSLLQEGAFHLCSIFTVILDTNNVHVCVSLPELRRYMETTGSSGQSSGHQGAYIGNLVESSKLSARSTSRTIHLTSRDAI